MTPGPDIKPGTHGWEASALTTAPSLLLCDLDCCLYATARHNTFIPQVYEQFLLVFKIPYLMTASKTLWKKNTSQQVVCLCKCLKSFIFIVVAFEHMSTVSQTNTGPVLRCLCAEYAALSSSRSKT